MSLKIVHSSYIRLVTLVYVSLIWAAPCSLRMYGIVSWGPIFILDQFYFFTYSILLGVPAEVVLYSHPDGTSLYCELLSDPVMLCLSPPEGSLAKVSPAQEIFTTSCPTKDVINIFRACRINGINRINNRLMNPCKLGLGLIQINMD